MVVYLSTSPPHRYILLCRLLVVGSVLKWLPLVFTVPTNCSRPSIEIFTVPTFFS